MCTPVAVTADVPPSRFWVVSTLHVDAVACALALLCCACYQERLKRFLPAKIISDDRKGELAATIRSRHKAHVGKKQPEVVAEYMRRVKAWKVRPMPMPPSRWLLAVAGWMRSCSPPYHSLVSGCVPF